MSLTIGVDVGGTKVAAGVVDEDGKVLASLKRVSPARSADATEDTIAAVVEELRKEHEVTAVGIGAAGFIDVSRSTVLFAPNLAWLDEPLQSEVARRVGLPVVVENDANAAAWAEYRFGAGQGARQLVVVTVGTGIGGGMVLDGSVYRGAFGIAAEFGHITVSPGGRRCGCGNRGCWEQYCSGKALVREARDILSVSRRSDGVLYHRAGGDYDNVTGPMVTEAAEAGDPDAVEAFAVVGEWLGRGLASVAAMLDPDVIVVGGGVGEAGDLLMAPGRAAYRESLTGRGHRPWADIRPASLGNLAGMVGAADLARSAG